MTRSRIRIVAALVAGTFLALAVAGQVLSSDTVAGLSDLRVGSPRHGDVAAFGTPDGSPAFSYTVLVGPETSEVVEHPHESVLTLRWNGTIHVLDPAGREVDADVVQIGGAMGASGPDVGSARFLYAGDGPAPWAQRRRVASGAGENSWNEGLASVRSEESYSEAALDYAPRPSLAHCLVRAGWQGVRFDDIPRLALADLCPAAAGIAPAFEDMGWTTVDGNAGRLFRAGDPIADPESSIHVNLGVFEASYESGRLSPHVDVVLAPGIPYPLAFTAVTPTDFLVVKLTGYAPGAGPEPAAPAPPASAPPVALAPTSRTGLADGASAYALDDAVAAVEGDRNLGAFQSWRSDHPDAFVESALVSRSESTCAGPARGVSETWWLGFRAGDGSSWSVGTSLDTPCGTDVVPIPGALRAMRAQNTDAGEGPPRVFDAPRPARAMSLAAAVRAFESQRVGNDRVAWYGFRLGDEAGTPGYVVEVGSSPLTRREGDTARLLFDAATGAVLQRTNWEDVERRTYEEPILAAGLAGIETTESSAPPLVVAAAKVPRGVYGGMSLLAVVALLLILAGARLGGLVVVGYTRLTRADVLSSPRRASILSAVRASPGLSHDEVRSATGLSDGGAGYHLAVLVRSGHLARLQSGGFTRYFVAGSADFARFAEEAVLLAGGAEARVLETARAAPGIAPAEIARRLGVTRVAVHYTLNRLEKRGLVERTREGARVRVVARGR